MRSVLLLPILALAGTAFAQNIVSYYPLTSDLAPTVNVGGNALPLEFRTGTAPTSPVPGGAVFVSDNLGGSRQVVSFSGPQFFRAVHGIGANGGGSYVNRYSILLDLKISDNSTGFGSVFNTSADNAVGGDGETYVDATGAVGISGDYAGSIPLNEWRRLIITVDTTTGTLGVGIDGVLVNTVGIGGVDGRFSAYTYNDNDTDGDQIDLFGDGGGFNLSGRLGAVAFFDGPLDEPAIAAFGQAGSPVPEPTSLAVLGFGLAAARRWRRK